MQQNAPQGTSLASSVEGALLYQLPKQEDNKILVDFFERFEGVRGIPPGVSPLPKWRGEVMAPRSIGNLLSHRVLLQRAKAENWQSVLIFEDDALIDPEANAIFDTVVKELPSDWDILYLGGNHSLWKLKAARKLVPVDPRLPIIDRTNRTERVIGLYRVTDMRTTHAIGVSASAYNRLLHALDPDFCDGPIDVNYVRLQPEMQAFVVRPHLAWQANEHYRDATDVENVTRFG